jgi:hypothetical protein
MTNDERMTKHEARIEDVSSGEVNDNRLSALENLERSNKKSDLRAANLAC